MIPQPPTTARTRTAPVLAAAVLLCAVGTVYALAGPAGPEESPESGPDWRPPEYQQVRQEALEWLATAAPDGPTRQAVEQRWAGEPVAEGALLRRLATTFGAADPRAAALLDLCSAPRKQLVPPSQAWLRDPATPPLMASNLRLLYGRWLVHQDMYDEALQWLDGLEPDQVVAPATLLFYQAAAHHQLLDRKEGLAATERLLRGEGQSPRRYVAVARLMQEDLGQLKDDSLDHIARRMQDVGRRSALGRANQRVRDIEDGVIDSLDKLIKKIEEQQKRQQSAANQGQGQPQSSRPAEESRIMGGKGEGEVTKRSLGTRTDWGSLPPKEREQALQQIGRDFPAHYRDVIEEYFRRKAAEGSR